MVRINVFIFFLTDYLRFLNIWNTFVKNVRNVFPK